MDVIKHGFFIMSANIIKKEDCDKIIDFIENNLSVFYKNVPRSNYNTNTLELNISTNPDIPGSKEIDDILFKYVGLAIKEFISSGVMIEPGIISNQIEDSGYQLRKVIGETVRHQDGAEITIRDNNKVSYRVGTLVMSLKDTGDTLIFPELDVKVPLGEGTITFFPPYWTHQHYTEWSGVDGYRVQTWITNTIQSK